MRVYDALRQIAERADAYAVCSENECHDCDLLRELRDLAMNALPESTIDEVLCRLEGVANLMPIKPR